MQIKYIATLLAGLAFSSGVMAKAAAEEDSALVVRADQSEQAKQVEATTQDKQTKQGFGDQFQGGNSPFDTSLLGYGIGGRPWRPGRPGGDGQCPYQSRNQCSNNYIGQCSGCNGVFDNPSSPYGRCTTGDYCGCPCTKCGGPTGQYVGSCWDSRNQCNGYYGVCTGGIYQGCPCLDDRNSGYGGRGGPGNNNGPAWWLDPRQGSPYGTGAGLGF